MTPIDKAKELVEKFDNTKVYALVAVNEILDFLNDDFINWVNHEKSSVPIYIEQTGYFWKQVKEEIQIM